MILMINGSMKSKNGNSQYFMQLLEGELAMCDDKKCEFMQIRDVLAKPDGFVEKLEAVEALVIGAPLYVDGLPAQVVRLMEMMLEQYAGKFQHMPVYVVSNLGFYEAEQIRHLFHMVENWCLRMGMTYGGGLAVGAGPMISTLKSMPLKSGLNKDIGKGLEQMAAAISQGKTMENYYCKTAIPRGAYMMAAHMTFGKTAKANGLKVKDVK